MAKSEKKRKALELARHEDLERVRREEIEHAESEERRNRLWTLLFWVAIAGMVFWFLMTPTSSPSPSLEGVYEDDRGTCYSRSGAHDC